MRSTSGFLLEELKDVVTGRKSPREEIMYYVHPSRTPYTYDTLAQYFDPDCELA